MRTGCHWRRRYIKKEDPLTPIKNTRDLDTFCFSNYYRKRKSRLWECRLVRKKVHEQLVYMCQWFACHLWGFRNAQGISWPNAENCTAAPPPQNSWHLRSRTAEVWLLSPKSLSIKALLQWSFIVVIACDNQANCSNNAGNDRHVCMDNVSCICAKFYTCINKTSVKCALYPGHWQIN